MQIQYFRKTLWVCVLLFSSVLAAGRVPATTAILWQDRGDISRLDLLNGPAGALHQPGSQFRFLKESSGGSSPKFEVQDENGTKWKVKLGDEAKSEVAAARLLWAAGYFADEDYYRSEISVDGLPPLSRGREYLREGGLVLGARLERHRSGPDPETWSWFENPFLGTREFNGLRALMALMNNWDLKDLNNAIYMEDGSSIYAVADLGATFGRTGSSFKRSKGDVDDYADSPFIDMATPEHVDLVLRSRPFFMLVLTSHHYYSERSKMSKVAKGIPIQDARWIGSNLSRLSSQQIMDCFRSSGFSQSEAETYTDVVMKRIAALARL